jgi:hypothetical protein
MKTAIILLACLWLACAVEKIAPRPEDVFNLESIDHNANKLIELEEFKAFIRTLDILDDHYKPQEIDELTQEAFGMFDQNADRILDHGEYETMVRHVGELREQHDKEASI